MLHDLSIVGSFITGAAMGIAAALVLFSVMWHMLLNDKSEPTRTELHNLIKANDGQLAILRKLVNENTERIGSFSQQLPPRVDIDKQLLDEATRTSRALVRMADNLEQRTVMLEQQHAIINRELFPHQDVTRFELVEKRLKDQRVDIDENAIEIRKVYDRIYKLEGPQLVLDLSSAKPAPPGWPWTDPTTPAGMAVAAGALKIGEPMKSEQIACLLCTKCHDTDRCGVEHVGHPGTCARCGRDSLVAYCDKGKPE